MTQPIEFKICQLRCRNRDNVVIELFAPGFFYSLAKDAYSILRRHGRTVSNSEILELRQKWKPIFEEKIWEAHKGQISADIIIRDVRRMDSYPDNEDKGKGISPWFRAGLMGTYHRGIKIGLRWSELKEFGEGCWRRKNYEINESGGVNTLLIGNIPFERVEMVDWDGDDFYYAPPHLLPL